MIKKILITGGTSSLGKILVPELISLKYDITFVLSKKINFFYPDIQSLSYADIRSKKYNNLNFDVILHMATVYDKRFGRDLVACNLRLPRLLLKKFVLNKQTVFINLDSFYSFRDNYPMKHRLYVQSKKKILKYIQKMAFNGSIRYLNIIVHHMFGPYDSSEKFIPNLILKGQLGDDIVLKNPYEMTNFIYVKDVAINIISLLQNIEKYTNKSIELKSSREISIRKASRIILDILKSPSKILDSSGQPIFPIGHEERLVNNLRIGNLYTFEAGIIDILNNRDIN